MIGHIKGKVEWKVGGERRRRKWKRERTKRRRRKKSRAEAHGLEKLQVLRFLMDIEEGRVNSSISTQSRGPACVHINSVVFSLLGPVWVGDLLQPSMI